MLSTKYTHLIAFVPTGWAHKKLSRQTPLDTNIPPTPDFNLSELEECRKVLGSIQLFRVPYSEHSSFRELAEFCKNVEVRRIIPTVK
jgi:DNA cross-link repair 1A protein